MAGYNGFRGSRTVQAVEEGIPRELIDKLTGQELGLVMSAVNAAYHRGRASLGGVDLCDDALWLPWGGPEDSGQLIPVAALRAIKIVQENGKASYALEYSE